MKPILLASVGVVAGNSLNLNEIGMMNTDKDDCDGIQLSLFSRWETFLESRLHSLSIFTVSSAWPAPAFPLGYTLITLTKVIRSNCEWSRTHESKCASFIARAEWRRALFGGA